MNSTKNIISLSMQLPFHENIRMLYGEHCGLGCYQCKLPPTSVSGCIFTYFYLGPFSACPAVEVNKSCLTRSLEGPVCFSLAEGCPWQSHKN